MNKIRVRVKKLHPDAVIPEYKTEGAAGFDLVAVEDVLINRGETKLVRTGLAFEIPPGYELQIRPRSGLSLETPLRIANAPGTVDSDYRGEVKIIVTNIAPYDEDLEDEYYIGSESNFEYIEKGTRIAQGVIAPVFRAEFEEVDELSGTERGAGGFGSTGMK